MPPVNEEEFRSYVGLKDLYAAAVTQDDSAAYVAGTPFKLAPACEASAEPKTDAKTQYADDGPFDPMTAEGETTMKLKITGLPVETQALISGETFDSTTGRMYDSGGATPPYYALGYRSERSNGKYRYFWYQKGRFSKPSDAFKSKADSPDPQIPELTFTAVKTIHQFDVGSGVLKGSKRVVGDEDTVNFSATTWFTQVQTPAVSAVSALALSSSTPADNATGISKTANLVAVFNNRLADGAEQGIVLTDAAGTMIALTRMVSTDRKTVTLAHAALAGTTVHLLGIGVKDIYAQTLEVVVSFTTIA
jgi:phi13 family phage major tail protein